MVWLACLINKLQSGCINDLEFGWRPAKTCPPSILCLKDTVLKFSFMKCGICFLGSECDWVLFHLPRVLTQERLTHEIPQKHSWLEIGHQWQEMGTCYQAQGWCWASSCTLTPGTWFTFSSLPPKPYQVSLPSFSVSSPLPCAGQSFHALRIIFWRAQPSESNPVEYHSTHSESPVDLRVQPATVCVFWLFSHIYICSKNRRKTSYLRNSDTYVFCNKKTI